MAGQEQDSKLKEKDFAKWVEGQTLDTLQEELHALESRRVGLRQHLEEMEQDEGGVSYYESKWTEERLAEVNRCIDAVKGEMIARRTQTLLRAQQRRPKTKPETAARRAVVQANAQLPHFGICELLDSEGINLPPGPDWEPYRSHNEPWTDAYRQGGNKLRSNIRVIISKDKSG